MEYRNLLQIDNTLISGDLLNQHFCCDLEECKGICCVLGDAGAPLTKDEVDLLPQIIHQIRPYMREEGIASVEMQGTHVIDDEGETVTPLIDGKECAYVIFENDIAFCAIEKAYKEKKIDFQKPVSCHLYPVRIRKYKQFSAVNYDIWHICHAARKKGEETNIRVFDFVKKALIRRFGENWYKQLSVAADRNNG